MKTMKHLFLMASMLIFFAACENDDPAPDQSPLLIGAWQIRSYVASNCTDPTENGTETCTSSCEILVFTSANVTIDGDGPYTYTTSGNSITINFAGGNTGTYSISGSTLTFTFTDSAPNGGCTNVSTYEKTALDVDGNAYHSVKIGSQVWMVENLKVTKYRNGDAIPNVTDGTAWTNSGTGAYCNYDNIAANADTYGRIYNWHAVNDYRKLAPEGWHVATDEEWTTLTTFLSGESVAGGKLKDTDYWQSPNTEATNETHFYALPGGTRYFDGGFDNQSFIGYWWTATDGWYRNMRWDESAVNRFGHIKESGMSVRCIRD